MMIVDADILTKQLRSKIFSDEGTDRTHEQPFKATDVIGCGTGYSTGVTELDDASQKVNGGADIVLKTQSSTGQIMITLTA